ncbi:hypothetical protein GC176_01800 [bacterium]|nr:hypothetical protein [bacterium]
MRQRQDFYTLCPSCETRISLPLAAKLQAARHGTSCHCPSCSNDWVCIQEWIYRDLPSQTLQQPVSVPPQMAPAFAPPARPAYATPIDPHPAHIQTPAAMPRPHLLPTYQPPQRIPQPAATAASQVPSSAQQTGLETPVSQPAPAPHAWSFERQPHVTQPATPSTYDRFDR